MKRAMKQAGIASTLLPTVFLSGFPGRARQSSPSVLPVTGYPITYSVAGKQYVAVSTGNSLVSSGLNRLVPELKPSAASNIVVFALGE